MYKYTDHNGITYDFMEISSAEDIKNNCDNSYITWFVRYPDVFQTRFSENRGEVLFAGDYKECIDYIKENDLCTYSVELTHVTEWSHVKYDTRTICVAGSISTDEIEEEMIDYSALYHFFRMNKIQGKFPKKDLAPWDKGSWD